MDAVTVLNIYDFLNELAPFSTQLDFDNSGFLVGSKDNAVNRALLSLDVTTDAVREAAESGCELVISHHPLIFDPLRSVSDETRTGRIVGSLLKNDISAICAHTNLDGASGGVAECFAAAAGLKVLGVLEGEESGLMRLCETDAELDIEDFARSLKEKLGSACVRFVSCGKRVRRVALGPGAGYGLPEAAIAEGCDTVLVGESKYHEFTEAADMGLNLIEVGHFASENVCLAPLAEKLREKFPTVKFVVSEQSFDKTRVV